LFNLVTDGAHHTPQYIEAGVPFLSVKDVSSGKISFVNTRYISEAQHIKLCQRCRPENGDIILTKVGTTGIAVPIDTDLQFSIFVSLALLKFSRSNLSQEYLCHLINSPFVRRQSAQNTQGIGNKNLVLRLINDFTLPIPPLAEQHRIVAKLDELIALCDQLETCLDMAAHTRRRLLGSLLAEALLPDIDRELEAAE
jgi:type I restriction enzyme S subunit